MVVYDNRDDTGVKNNVALNDDLMVIEYNKESSSPSLKYVEAGALVLWQETLSLIRENGPVSLEKGLYPTLIQQREMAAYISQQRFYDIGTLKQQKVFEEFLQGSSA